MCKIFRLNYEQLTQKSQITTMYYVQNKHHNSKKIIHLQIYERNKLEESLTKETQPSCVYYRNNTKQQHRTDINHNEQLTQTLLLIALQL